MEAQLHQKKKLINWGEMYSAMMCGISHMIPVIVVGGIIMSIPNFWMPGEVASATEGVAHLMYTWGSSLFGMMYLILAMYTAYGIADRAALLPGIIVGLITQTYGAGFLGAVIGGLVAGYVVRFLIKLINVPPFLEPAKGILFLPLVSGIVMFALMEFIIGPAMAWLMDLIYQGAVVVDNIGSKPLLAGVIGACYDFGMGGPICYGVYPVSVAYMAVGDFSIESAGMVACSASCLGIAMSILLFPKKYTPEERADITGALSGWVCEITEFQIPFFIRDIKTFTPCFILTGFIGGWLTYTLGCVIPAVHGGLFVVPLCNKPLLFMLCHLIQASLTCAYIALFKKDLPEEDHCYVPKKQRLEAK